MSIDSVKEVSCENSKGNDKVITIVINENWSVELCGNIQTGLSIKDAAVEQGVPIDSSFVLSVERGNGQNKIFGDEDKISIHNGLVFHAIPDDDNSFDNCTAVVASSIEKIQKQFPNSSMEVIPDGSGGAYVIIDSVELGAPYVQQTTWLGFRITDACPYVDVYPHFVRPDLMRMDNSPLGAGMSPNAFTVPGGKRDAIQISRKSNKQIPPTDSWPLLKLLKVMKWLKSQ